MPDTGNAKDWLKLPATKFLIFKLKNMTWQTYLIGFTVLQYCSISFCLYRACFTHLISSNLSCNLCLWYYDQLVHFNKEINANVYRHSLWEYSKRFHCSFEWHLTPHMTLPIETCIRRTPYTAFPEGVRLIQVSLYFDQHCYVAFFWTLKQPLPPHPLPDISPSVYKPS